MNKGLKKGLKITGVTVAVILVFMLVLPFMFKDKVIIIVKKEANEMLNAKLDFESPECVYRIEWFDTFGYR